jgi:hypothetical protein
MRMIASADTELLPGEGLDASKIPGHWLLARPGKRVLRPGGLELTRQLLETLDIRPCENEYDQIRCAPHQPIRQVGAPVLGQGARRA